MSDLRKAKWIFFDTGNVLIDTYNTEAAWADVASRILRAAGFSYSPALLLETQRSSAADGSLDTRRGALHMLGITHQEFERQINRHGWPSHDEPYPDVDEALKALTRCGYRLGLIADDGRAQDHARLEWSGLMDRFEVTVLPDPNGLTKPNPAFFALAVQLAGCHPTEAIMVGDSILCDIVPAKQIGMHTVWLRRGLFDMQLPRTAESEPNMVVRSLPGLVNLLERPAS